MQTRAVGQKEIPTCKTAAREEGKSSTAPAVAQGANGTSGRAAPGRADSPANRTHHSSHFHSSNL